MPEQNLPMYGGQAVIEGVMMRGRSHMAMAMRSPDGKIVLHSETLAPIYRSPIARIPFLRGLVLLWDALALGSAPWAFPPIHRRGKKMKNWKAGPWR